MADRDANGRFQPGNSLASVGGRTRGLSRAEQIRTLLEPRRDELIGELLKVAFDPSPENPAAKVNALREALSRLAPTPKQESEHVVIPNFSESASMDEKAKTVMDAVAAGQISVDAGERLMRFISIYIDAIKTSDLEKRISSIEQGRRTSVIEGEIVGRDLV